MEMMVLLPRDLESTSPHEPMWSLVVAAFLQERGSRTGSRRTVETYGRIIRRFLRTVADAAAATPLDVHRFSHAPTQDGRPPAPSTILTRLAAVGGLYEFAVRMRVAAQNPAAAVGRPAVRLAQPRGLTVAEIARLLAVIPDTPAGHLDRALIVTALLTGLRRSELVSLRLTMPDGRDRVCYEVRTKGGVMRRREIPSPALEAIVAAIEARGPGSHRGEGAVFAVADSTFALHLRRHAEAAGLADVSCHVLRHTAAKLRREAGASIEEVGNLLGHRSIATTAMYLRRLEDEEDRGWEPVARTLGLAERSTIPAPARPSTTAGSQMRLRPVHSARRDGRGNGHPANRIGDVNAHLPRHQGTAR
jgi:site-specific recombinase XerD